MSQPHGVKKGNQTRLRNVYEEHREVVELLIQRDQWAVDDVPMHGKPYVAAVHALQNSQAIREVDQRWRDRDDHHSGNFVSVWEWVGQKRELLREYVDGRNELPCGCRAHVYHKDGGGYGCRYCDVEREYSRETVKEAI